MSSSNRSNNRCSASGYVNACAARSNTGMIGGAIGGAVTGSVGGGLPGAATGAIIGATAGGLAGCTIGAYDRYKECNKKK